jgi:hypothetical protein
LETGLRGASIGAPTVATAQDRTFVALTNRQIDRARGAWDERDRRRLVSLADDPQGAMTALEAEVLDVGGA